MMYFMNKSIKLVIVTLVLLIAFTIPVFSQQSIDEIPDQIQFAINDLSQRLNQTVTLETLTAFDWADRRFADTSLDCPQPGQVYSQFITPGYQFFLSFGGQTYDYRVSDDGQIIVLCSMQPADLFEQTPTATSIYDPQPCGDTYTVVDGDTLNSVADLCATTVEALLDVNPEIDDRSLIFEGQILNIPQSISGVDLLPTPTLYNGQSVSITPRIGSPGTEVQLTAFGFPANVEVEIGVGRWESEYDVIDTQTTDVNGQLDLVLTVPSFATVGEQWVFVVVLNFDETISGVFEVVDDTILTPTATPNVALFERTNIYLIALGDGGQTGDAIGCGDSVIPVEVVIEPTVAPLTSALEYILDLDTRMYGQSGLYNALYLSDLTLQSIDIEDGEAQINLSGDLNVGGVCDYPRIVAQIYQTALQYFTIDSVTVNINGETFDPEFAGN